MSDTSREFGNYLWGLFVKACGNRCCACLKEPKAEEILHRGHLQPRTDGGSAFLDNLAPLCKACNSKFKDGYTADTRPAEWPDAFLQLLMDEMNVEIYTRSHENTPAHINGAESTDTKVLTNSNSFKFGPKKHYHTHTSTRTQMTASQVEEVIEQAKNLHRNDGEIPEPKPPLRKVQDEWRGLIAKHGRKDFLNAVWGYLREPEPPWLKNGEALVDSWVFFAPNFLHYLEKARKRIERAAEVRKRERQRLIDLYREVRSIPLDWPLLTYRQREVIESTPENPEDHPEAHVLYAREKALEEYKRLGPEADLGTLQLHLVRCYLQQMPDRWQETQQWQSVFYAVKNAEDMAALKPLITVTLALWARRTEAPPDEDAGFWDTFPVATP
jgi:hypothetical protein